MGQPFLPNLDLIAATATRATNSPLIGNRGTPLYNSILASLRVVDEQDHVNKYAWSNLPNKLSGQLIERILYYRGQGAFFYVDSMDQFFFLPFAGEGLDVYGRYKEVTPLPFTGSASSESKDAKPFISGKKWKPIYDIIMPEDLKASDLTDCRVILTDYTKQLPQKVIPRCILQEPLLQVMSECVPFARTCLINNTGVDGLRVTSEDEQAYVTEAASAVVKAALNGDRWVPVQGSIDMVELSGRNSAQVQDYLLALQSMDNLRLSWHGLDNGGLFLKNSHILAAEQKMNDGNAAIVYQDGLINRQIFSNICNSIWGLGTWCDPSEVVTGTDKNLDGEVIEKENPAEGQEANEIAFGGDLNV